MSALVLRVLFVATGLAGLAVVLVTSRNELDVVAAFLPFHVHALALLFVLIEIAARSLRSRWLASAVHRAMSLPIAIAAQLAGDAAAAVTPARVGADPVKLMFWRRADIDAGTSAAIMVGEIVAETMVLLLLTGALTLATDAGGEGLLGAAVYLVWIGAGIALAIATSRFLAAGRFPRFARPLLLRARVSRVAARVLLALRRLGRMRANAAVVIALLTAVHIAARIAVLPLLALGVAPLSSLDQLAGIAVLLLYGSVIVPLPSGGGTVELAFRTGLAGILAGIDGIAVLAWWRFYTHYFPVVLGALILVTTNHQLSRSDGISAATRPGRHRIAHSRSLPVGG